MLAELQQLALEFDFVIQHLPADLLSRSGLELKVNAIELTTNHLAAQQARDPEIGALMKFRETGTWPNSLPQDVRKSMEQVESGFTTDSHCRFWVRTNSPKQIRNLLWAPRILRQDILKEAHGSRLTGHSAIEHTIERNKVSWKWPMIKANVKLYI